MPMQNLSINSYNLINGALSVVGGFGSIREFFETGFADQYGGVKWRSLYTEATPTIEETYTQLSSKKGIPIMASYVAFDAEAPKLVGDKIQLNTGSMPRMKLSFDFNEKSLRDSLKIVKYYNGTPNYNGIYNAFLKNSVDLLSGLHAQINYTGFQIESTGQYISTEENNGGGLIGLQFDFGIPEENKKGAGGYGKQGKKKAWSDSSAYPIGDILDMIQYATDNFIPVGVIRMNKQTWNTLRNHTTTITQIAINSTSGLVQTDNIDKLYYSEKSVKSYLEDVFNLPIEVVDELSVVRAYNPKTRKLEKLPIRSFADNTVLLRPAGTIGELQSSLPTLDFATNSNPAYTTEGGLFAIYEEVYSKRKAMEITAEFTGIPVLNYPEYMLYLDTSKAAS